MALQNRNIHHYCNKSFPPAILVCLLNLTYIITSKSTLILQCDACLVIPIFPTKTPYKSALYDTMPSNLLNIITQIILYALFSKAIDLLGSQSRVAVTPDTYSDDFSLRRPRLKSEIVTLQKKQIKACKCCCSRYNPLVRSPTTLRISLSRSNLLSISLLYNHSLL
jgi:hypothetical protein